MRARSLLRLLAAALALAASPAGARSEVVLDGSMGTAGPVPELDRDYEIGEALGRRAGENLFHSFERFDIPESFSATFTAESALDRIVARVTGGEASRIDGTLRSLAAGADLYFLNPSGVMFGQTARLELPASFHVSTAPLLRFADASAWPTGEPSNDLLSVAEPAAFGFLDAPASIEVRRAELAVKSGEHLSLVGGDLELLGALRVPTLAAPGGQIALASARSELDIPIDVAALEAARGAERLGRISLAQQTLIDVSSPTGTDLPAGRIVVRGGELAVLGSRLTASSRASTPVEGLSLDLAVERGAEIGLGSIVSAASLGAGRGGDVRVRAGELLLRERSVLGVAALGAGASGDLEVDAGKVSIRESGQLATQSTASGAAGSVRLRADALSLESGGELLSDARRTGPGGDVDVSVRALELARDASIASSATGSQGGAISLRAGSLELASGAQVLSLAEATGVGGAVTVVAETLRVSGGEDSPEPTQIATRALGSGTGGDLAIAVHELEVVDGGQVSTTAESSGQGGDLSVEGARRVLIAGANALGPSGLFARAAAPASGAGGDLRVEAESFALENGAQLSARTFGKGAAGDLSVEARELVVRGGPNGASVISTRGFDGPGGDLRLESETLHLLRGGLVSASTLRFGDSGDVDVVAGHVTIAGSDPLGGNPSGIFAQSNALPDVPGAGDAGSVRLRTDVLDLADGGRISVQTRGEGESGDISIEAANRVRVASSALISAESTGTGDAGNIAVDAGQALELEEGAITTEAEQAFGGNVRVHAAARVVLDRSRITTSVGTGEGKGGDIDVDPRFVVLKASSILARADAGSGGNISIVADHLLRDAASTIDASSRLGIDGQVFLSSPETDLSGELGRLPESFLDAASRMDPTCAASAGRRGSFRILPGPPEPPGPESPLVILPGSLDTE